MRDEAGDCWLLEEARRSKRRPDAINLQHIPHIMSLVMLLPSCFSPCRELHWWQGCGCCWKQCLHQSAR